MVPISSIDTTARVGEDEDPAVEIWFGPGDRALRYRWSDDHDEIKEETYRDGVVHDSLGLGGSRDELVEYALESIAEYVGHYRDNPHDLRRDWPHVADLLADADAQGYQSDIDDLLSRGLSPAEAVDYHAVENRGLTQTEWAKRRGVSQEAVSKNVRKAREKLS